MAANSENAESGKCFSGILRRLLCSGSLPTHPSDDHHLLLLLDKFDPTTKNHPMPKQKKKPILAQTRHRNLLYQVQQPPQDLAAATPAPPGIVARLMGLDSMPDINWVPKQTSLLDSFPRSRSVSSVVDYLPRFDNPKQQQTRKSVSFREVPTFLSPQNRDYFMLCFDRNNEEGPKLRKKPEVGFQEKKASNVDVSENKVGMRKKVVEKKKKNSKKSCKRAVLPHKKEVCKKSTESLRAKSQVKATNIKRKNGYAVKNEDCKSVTSSSASVSDLHDFRTPFKAPVPGESGEMSSSSKKSSSRTSNKYDYPRPNLSLRSKSNAAHDEQEVKAIASTRKADKPVVKKSSGNKATSTTDKAASTTDIYLKMLAEVFRLTEEDTKGCSWVVDDSSSSSQQVIKSELYGEEMCLLLGQHILEVLLIQLVDELCNP